MHGRPLGGMARYRLLAVAAVATIALIGAGGILRFAAGGISGPTLTSLAIAAAFVLALAGAGLWGVRRTSTPYW